MVNLHSLPDDDDQYQSFCTQRSKHQTDWGNSMKQELPQSWMTDLIFWTQLVRLGTSNHVVQCMMHCPMHDAFLESIFPASLMYFTISQGSILCFCLIHGCSFQCALHNKNQTTSISKSSTSFTSLMQKINASVIVTLRTPFIYFATTDCTHYRGR